MNEIKLKQEPVIEHQLSVIGEEVTVRIKELNLDAQVATNDTIQTLKKLRADLNKELVVWETQRKAIKTGVNNPYIEFEAEYKKQISDKYKSGLDKLKTKISEFELKLKDQKRDIIKSYFEELCSSINIDYIPFEKLGIEINLSTSEKKYKEQCNSFIETVNDDLKLIDSQEYKTEMLVEFKKTLNASKAITAVLDRKKEEAEEAERLKKQEYLRRAKRFTALGLTPDKETGTYFYSDDIYVVWDSVKDLNTDDFNAKVVEIELLITQSKEVVVNEQPKKESSKTEVSQPLKQPVKEENQELVSAKFKVEGTFRQLKALGQYMKDNNITYKNI